MSRHGAMTGPEHAAAAEALLAGTYLYTDGGVAQVADPTTDQLIAAAGHALLAQCYADVGNRQVVNTGWARLLKGSDL